MMGSLGSFSEVLIGAGIVEAILLKLGGILPLERPLTSCLWDENIFAIKVAGAEAVC